jgi:hypothetical protein
MFPQAFCSLIGFAGVTSRVDVKQEARADDACG